MFILSLLYLIYSEILKLRTKLTSVKCKCVLDLLSSHVANVKEVLHCSCKQRLLLTDFINDDSSNKKRVVVFGFKRRKVNIKKKCNCLLTFQGCSFLESNMNKLFHICFKGVQNNLQTFSQFSMNFIVFLFKNKFHSFFINKKIDQNPIKQIVSVKPLIVSHAQLCQTSQ